MRPKTRLKRWFSEFCEQSGNLTEWLPLEGELQPVLKTPSARVLVYRFPNGADALQLHLRITEETEP